MMNGNGYTWNGTSWVSVGPLVGPKGADGLGVPSGGSTGQILAKIDGTDYNTHWVAAPTGGGGGGGVSSYNDLTDKPTLFSGSYTDLSNKPVLFDGAYASLTGKPTIPTQYTDALARAAVSVTGSLSYNATTGVISYTTPATRAWSSITSTPTTLAGYGITDAATSASVATNTTNIATNTTNIAANTAAIGSIATALTAILGS